MTKREATRQCRKLTRYWHKRLGLEPWRVLFVFSREALDESMRGDSGHIIPNSLHRTAKLALNERLDPKWYQQVIVHELLHLKWHVVEEALDALTEPAKTVLWDTHHAALNHVSKMFIGAERTFPLDGGEMLKRAPWESVV